MSPRRIQRPRPHLLTPQARDLLGNIGLSVAGAGALMALKLILDTFPFLIGG